MASPGNFKTLFLEPTCARHKQYEMLRARFVDGEDIQTIADRFQSTYATVHTHIRDFREALDAGEKPEFFLTPKPGPKSDRKKPTIREHVVRLRARRYASTDIHTALGRAGFSVSLSLVNQVIREEGLHAMTKRTRKERERVAKEIQTRQVPGLDIPVPAAPEQPAVADVKQLGLSPGRTLHSRFAGAFLFLPLLARVGLDRMVQKAHWPGTKMIPAINYGLSLLSLKLLDKERKSHIADWNFDPGLGLWAGLNVLPKTTATTDYAYRLGDSHYPLLMQEWVKGLYPILCPQGASAFALDAHAIAYRGDPALLQTHYVPTQGKKQPAIVTFFARATETPFLCFANADLRKEDLAQLPLKFVDYWQELFGTLPQWLYFDSRTTTYEVLEELNRRGVFFITIRKRGSQILNRLRALPDDQWTSTTIHTSRQPHLRIRYHDQPVTLKRYDGTLRQIALDGARRLAPSLFLTNHEAAPAREILERYHQRNYVENEIGVNVNFFHLDCLASEVALNVNMDTLMTLVANGCYRWLASELKGCQTLQPKQIYRKFVDRGGQISVTEKNIQVHFDRRAHNPILQQAHLDDACPPIPWLGNKRLKFSFA